MGRGDPKSRIMIIGEAPGGNEARTGIVFSGRAGQLLDSVLRETSLAESESYISNCVKCRPSDNRTPERMEWEACRQYLEREVRAVRPRFVLLLGNTALRAVARKSGITKHRGVRLEVRDPLLAGASVMATIHPAYVLRNPGQSATFTEDVRRFARLVEGTFESGDIRTRIVDTTAGVKKLVELMQKAKVIAYDTEDRYRPGHPLWSITVFGVSMDGERGFVVPLAHPDSPFRKRWQDLARYLANGLIRAQRRGAKLVAQSGKHDNVQLAGVGAFVEHNFDIMLAAHVLDENRPKNLGYLAQSLLGADTYKGSVELAPEKILKVPLRDLSIYNSYDVGYTWQIYPKLKAELLEHEGLTRLFSKLIMPASHTLQKVEFRGMYLNRDRLWERIGQTQELINKQVEVIVDAGAPEDINLNSPQQLGRWLFGKKGLGLSPVEMTKSGAPSTREAVLLHYRDVPAIRALMEYRTYQLKWMNTYLLPWSARIDRRGRLHTAYKIYGTVTGRLSGDLQQVPRDPFIRSVVGAPPGKQFVVADFSQIELRIVAHCAGDKRMQRAFLTGEDLHLVTAASLTGKVHADITKEERKKAKSVNFGFAYSMGAKKFSSYAFENYDVRISPEESVLAREKFFETFSDLERWHDRQRRIVHSLHQVRSPFGRLRHLPDILSTDRQVVAEAERQAINSPIQSAASDLMLFSMIKLDGILDPSEAYMVGTLHDGIFFEINEDKVDKWVPVIKEVMESLPLKQTFGFEFIVPIVADVEYGQHWGEPTFTTAQ